MTDIANAFAFHLNNARKALLRATGQKLTITEGAAHAHAVAEVRDGVRKLFEQHRAAETTLRMLAGQTAPLTREQRAAFAEFANEMRVARGEAPLRVALDS